MKTATVLIYVVGFLFITYASNIDKRIHLSRIVVIEIFSFFSSKTDFRFEFLVKTYVYAGNFSLIQ